MVGLNTVVCGIGSEVESAMVLLFISILILLQALLVESEFLSSIMSLGCAIFSLLTAKEHLFILLSFVVEEALVVGLCLYDDDEGSEAVVNERKVIQDDQTFKVISYKYVVTQLCILSM